MTSFLVGIDEAGRGPLAGPVSVGVVVVPGEFDWSLVSGAKDSKMLTPRARERLYQVMIELRLSGRINFAVGFGSARDIDTLGIVPTIAKARDEALTQLALDPSLCEVRLDGGLRAPDVYLNQTTIIRGDQLEPVISMASIAAKVERDRVMVALSSRFPQYGFEIHKGYGTKAHRDLIAKNGLSTEHRATFCRGALLLPKNTL